MATRETYVHLHRRSRLVVSQEHGIRYGPGLDVPMLPGV